MKIPPVPEEFASLKRRRKTNPNLILVPTYNERRNIESVYRRVFRNAKNCDLMFIDDNSPDGTGQLVEALARKDKRVQVLHRPGKEGLGTAYIQGLKAGIRAGYQNLLAMDADLQHDPVNIPRMLDLMKDYDLVMGSRYVTGGVMENWGRSRLLISGMANLCAKILLGLNPQDCTCGYKCYKASFLKRIDLDRILSKGYVFQVEILFRMQRAGARIAEIPIVFQIRHQGVSKLNIGEMTHFAWILAKLRFLTWLGRG